jgi:hypothetical protein
MCSKADDDSKTVKHSAVENRIMKLGHKKKDLKQCLDDYENLQILYINDARTEITLI